MRKAIGWLTLLSVICLFFGTLLSGCAPKTEGIYRQYSYDAAQNKFVYLQTQMQLSSDMRSYEITYYDTVHLMGTVEKAGAGYLLQCEGNVHVQIAQAIAELTEKQPVLTEETKDAWAQAFVTQEQMFVYGDYLFSSASIDLMRRVKEGDNKHSYTALEGYYESVSDTDSVYLFQKGKVYATEVDEKNNYRKDDKGEPILSTTPNATYTVANGFVILTRVDTSGNIVTKNGKPVRAVYLMASISYPSDLADIVDTDDDYSENVKAIAREVAGKSVGVLTRTFYTTNDMSNNDYNG